MTVVECSGFAAAQVILNVSQSTISRQIGDLETRFGMRLCQRGTCRLPPDRQGTSRLRGMSEPLDSAGELSRHGRAGFAENWSETFQLLSSTTGSPSAVFHLPTCSGTSEDKARNVHIHFHTLAPDEIERTVLENRVILGIGVFHQHRPGLVYEVLYDDPLELYCGRDHPFFDRETEELGHRDLLAADYIHRAYLSELQVAPLTAGLNSTATARQMEGVAFLILSGWHIGYLPVSYAERWVTAGCMRSILPGTYRLNTKIEMVTRRGVDLTLVSQTFSDILLEITRPLRS